MRSSISSVVVNATIALIASRLSVVHHVGIGIILASSLDVAALLGSMIYHWQSESSCMMAAPMVKQVG